MQKPCTILGIESSCDETSAAIVVDGCDVRSNLISSQVELHAKYGGVVPEIASRAHIERIQPIVAEAMDRAGATPGDLDAIAVTDGPGLVGSLLIGVTAAQTLSLAWDLPLVAVDHIHAHCTSAALASSGAGRGVAASASPAVESQNAHDTREPPWPAIALVVSGGHTSLYHVRDFLDIELLGETIDDAAGEAFDKVAAILELGFPGGPAVDAIARGGDPTAVRFPRTWLAEGSLDFSFSGLKTAVLYHVYGSGRKYGSVAHLSQQDLADIAASFQAALVEVLVKKTLAAANRSGVTDIVLGGGVAANSALRAALREACAEGGLRLTLSAMEYCADNAAMIAALGYHLLKAGSISDLGFEPRAGLMRTKKIKRKR